MNLQQKISEFTFGSLLAEDLPRLAQDALQDYDSPSLRILAASDGNDNEQLRGLFAKALCELGLRVPSPDEAALAVAKTIAEDIVHERVTPYAGARKIWWDIYTRFPDLSELRIFVGLASEYEDDEAHRNEYERKIIEESRKIISS